MNKTNFYDLIIIGSGPAGMTAAIYARRFGLRVGIFEYNAPGGAIINTEVVNNYPGFNSISGADLSMRMFEQMMGLSVDYIGENVQEIKKINEKEFFVIGTKEYIAKSIIIATGTKYKNLGIENEKKYFYKGISWCAICDGPLYKGRDVAVVGGGNSALSSALTLSAFSRKVYLIHRRDSYRGEQSIVDKVKSMDNIVPINNSVITDFMGDGLLDAITVKNVLTGYESNLSISCLFENVGKEPNTSFLGNLVELTQDGYIITDSDAQTSVKGIFACGDVVNKSVRQISTAVSDGTIAAVSANNYLK